MTLLIRPETPEDVQAVQALIEAAFAPAGHAGDRWWRKSSPVPSVATQTGSGR